LRTRIERVSEALQAIPAGSDVLIDANVFIYGLTAQSAQCKAFLERCSREEVTGISLYEILHETTHKFMIAEARAKGLFAGPEKGAKYLSRHPEEVKLLADYWVNTLKLLALNVILLPMEQSVLQVAQAERVAAGLLTNDSIIVAAMREYGISQIATNDNMFDTVAGVSVFSPTDLIV
jgi:predicted nucleic acid-binding protein